MQMLIKYTVDMRSFPTILSNAVPPHLALVCIPVLSITLL